MLLSSCQKDPEVLAATDKPKTDTVTAFSSGNTLASSGTLTIKFRDTTYIFDASKDSVAFISVTNSSKDKYFGITAINKAHNLSFGISSPGSAAGSVKTNVAGSQLLFKEKNSDSFFQYSLARLTTTKEASNFSVLQYGNGKVIAKGSFTVYLSFGDQLTPDLYKAEGSFDLRTN